MSEAETPAPEAVPETAAAPEPGAPELDVSAPVEPAEAPPLPPDPNIPPVQVTTSAEQFAEPTPAPVADTGVLSEMLAELRDLKAKIVAAIGG